MTTPLHHRHRDPKPELTYYVSGPMRGIPRYNFPLFDSCAAWLRSEGYGAINPADHDRSVEPDVESTEHYKHGDPLLKRHDDGVERPGFHDLIGWDLREIASPHCHGIVMLPGWEKSSGAAHERYVAEATGKQVWLAHYSVRGVGDPHQYEGWYVTLCEDRLLSSFTSEGLRQAISPTLHDPNHAMDREGLKARGWREREPDTFVKDVQTVRQGSPFVGTGGNGGGSLQPTPTPTPMMTLEEHKKYEDPRTFIERFNEAATMTAQIGQFQTKDSGVREEFTSGMVRDTQEGKPRYDLIPLEPLKRLAELYARGAQKYGDRNWEKATGAEELERFKASGLRHFFQALMGDRDEDHWAGAVFNIFGAMWLEERLSQVPSVMENDKDA